MSLLLLANPAAGGRRARRLLPQLRRFFERRVSTFDYVEGDGPGEVRRRAARAAEEGYHRVLAAGGDGTLHAVLNGLRGTSTALGILPLGHGNDLARAFGIPLQPLAAAEFLLRAPVCSVDIAVAGEEAYLGVASVGLDAEANRRANQWGGWLTGHTRYLLAGLRTLATYRPLRLEVTTDNEQFSCEVMLAVVANTPCYGGGIRIAPRALADDGLLDLCLVERRSRSALLRLYPAIRRGQHLGAAGIRYVRARRVLLREPPGAPLFADGEFLGRLPVEISVLPAALRVVGRPG